MTSPAAIAKAADWLRRANDLDVNGLGRDLQRWLDEGARQRLGQALGLERVGGKSARRALALAERNAMLKRLHSERWPDLDPRAAAKTMIEDFRAYEERRWKRERDRLDVPAGEPAATWWRILRGGVKMPALKQLSRILARDIR